MDPKLEHATSNFFDQIFQFLLLFIATPFVLFFLLAGILLYYVFRDSRDEKIRKWLNTKLSTAPSMKLSQRGAIRSISLIFDEHVKHYNYLGHHDLNFEVIEASVDRVSRICELHKLPRDFVEYFIDACIALVNTRKYNSIYLKLTTKFQR